jgi:hypothetical protein
MLELQGDYVARNSTQGFDIYVMSGDGVTRAVTHDGRPKDLPVFSPDGNMIAYVASKNPSVAAATILIVDLNGDEVGKALIEPAGRGIAYQGLREVDQIAWLGSKGQRLAITGSINPTQSVTYVIDFKPNFASSRVSEPATGLVEEDSYVDDAQALSLSPNGNHIATIGDMPHFDLFEANLLKPKLYLDAASIAVRSRPYLFVSPLAWSDDSSQLAFITRDSSSAKTLMFTRMQVGSRGANRLMKSIDISTTVGRSSSDFDLFWEQGSFVLVSPYGAKSKSKAMWKLPSQGDEAIVSLGAQVTSSFLDAQVERERIFGRLLTNRSGPPIENIDIWCKDEACKAISARPRQFPDRPPAIFDPLQN